MQCKTIVLLLWAVILHFFVCDAFHFHLWRLTLFTPVTSWQILWIVRHS